MFNQTFHQLSFTKKTFLQIALLLLVGKGFAQQKEYNFNAPGSICNFEYVCYSPNNEYSSIKRPFIFVLGKSGETAKETFQNDTLKDLPQFYNYEFVYI